jgi:hypothetical protein
MPNAGPHCTIGCIAAFSTASTYQPQNLSLAKYDIAFRLLCSLSLLFSFFYCIDRLNSLSILEVSATDGEYGQFDSCSRGGSIVTW